MINLANLNEVTLSEDRSTTRVGPGNVWSDVYAVLDPLGVSVVGGREAGVGVGGLTLGGEWDSLYIFMPQKKKLVINQRLIDNSRRRDLIFLREIWLGL